MKSTQLPTILREGTYTREDLDVLRTTKKIWNIRDIFKEQLVELFEIDSDLSEKIAKLKAARRAKIYNSHNHIIVTTEVGAFEPSAASVLVRLGADVAFAGATDDKGKMLISARCRNSFRDKSGFNIVTDVFSKLPGFFDGEGGGHPAAAAFNGKGDAIQALKKCVELTDNALEKKYGKGAQLKEYK